MTAKFGSEIGFEAQHFRIGMGMPAMPPGNIPVCLSYFAADEQTGVKIDLILVGERDQVIKLLECHRIVIAGPGLEPGPEHVEADDAVPQFVHLGEIRLNLLGLPLNWPLHSSLRRDPMRANRQESLAFVGEIRSVQMNLWQTKVVRRT